MRIVREHLNTFILGNLAGSYMISPEGPGDPGRGRGGGERRPQAIGHPLMGEWGGIREGWGRWRGY